jgi:hypothetical protein
VLKKVLIGILLQMLFVCLFSVALMAQGGDPPPFDPVVNDLVPLDGGLTMLLAAGVAYGAKKAKDFRRK